MDRKEIEEHTCEELEYKHAAAHLLEDLIPHPATTLKAPLTDIQDIITPEDPAEHEVDEGKGQDDGACRRIGQGYDVDEHHDADLPPIPDAVWPQSCHLIPVRLGRPCTSNTSLRGRGGGDHWEMEQKQIDDDDVQDPEESVRFKGMCGLPQMRRILERVSDSRGCMTYRRRAGF